MAASRFERLEELFHAAIALELPERDAFVESSCTDDPDLRSELRNLLQTAADTVRLRRGVQEAVRELESHDAPDIPGLAVVRQLGAGGMGVVFEAHDAELHRNLAIKVLPRGAAGDRECERFLAEAQVTGQLDHPGVVPLHALGRDPQGRPYFTMRLVAGKTAHEVFALARAEREGWSLAKALEVVLKVCDAVAYAHDKGIVHRDLKPENVMVGRFGEVYVLDWGLAKSRHRAGSSAPGREGPGDAALATLAGTVVGTPSYMPPEQAHGCSAEVDERSDVYSLGACLYTLLTGRIPYVEPGTLPTASSILTAVRAGPPPSVQQLNPSVAPELAAVCDKAMARDRAARYQSTTALAEDLRAWLDHRVVRAYRTGAWPELALWVRRNRGLASSLLATLLTAVAGTIGIGMYAVRADANASLASRKTEEATRHLAHFLQLADAVTLRELTSEADGLWPEEPGKVAAMDDWLHRARALLARRPTLEAALREIDAAGADVVIPRAATLLEHPRAAELGIERRRLRAAERELAMVAPNGEVPTPAAATQQQAIERHIEGLRRTIATLEREVQIAAPPNLPTSDRFLREALARLLQDMTDLAAPDGLVFTMQKRRDWAATVNLVTIVEAKAAWDEALAAIADPVRCPHYQGRHFAPQSGLVPLGRDPDSGLWEFWHPRTGSRPERDRAGRLVIRDDTGIVLVLLPGGSFWMGAQDTDAGNRNYDRDSTRGVAAPVHSVALEPLLLAKYETTQGQWLSIMGNNPSRYGPETRSGKRRLGLRHPVEQVTFLDCFEFCRRLGLRLPTEAHWEYACRAGTGSVFHTGDTVASLRGFANIADAGAGRFSEPGYAQEADFDDGHGVHAPVGSFRPNAFGLYDMHGNVGEWCGDGYADYRLPAQSGDGARGFEDSVGRVHRGGGFNAVAARVRSAARARVSPTYSTIALGCRAALAVTK